MTTEEKIDKIFQDVQEIKIDYAKTIVHLEQHRKEIDEHNFRLELLDALKNKTLGIVGIIGLCMGAFAGWLLHYLTK